MLKEYPNFVMPICVCWYFLLLCFSDTFRFWHFRSLWHIQMSEDKLKHLKLTWAWRSNLLQPGAILLLLRKLTRSKAFAIWFYFITVIDINNKNFKHINFGHDFNIDFGNGIIDTSRCERRKKTFKVKRGLNIQSLLPFIHCCCSCK